MNEKKPEYHTRKFKSGDETQIVSLLKEAYKKWPFFDINCMPEEHWNWRYNTTQLKTLVSLMEINNKIIACSHNTLKKIKINEKYLLASYGTDLCVHPDFQGKGVYPKITASMKLMRAQNDVKFTYMVAVNPKVINSTSRKRNFPHKFPYKVNYLSKIININKHIEAKDLKPDIATRLRQLVNITRSYPVYELDLGVNITTVKEFESKVDTFSKNMMEQHDFIINISRDYLNWRYCDPRSGDYLKLTFEENNQMEGYAVFRINKLEEYHVGYVVELLTSTDRLDIAEALLQSGLNYFNENDVNKIDYQLTANHPFEKLFHKYGFRGDEGNRYLFYNYTGDEDLMLDNIAPNKVHFSFGNLTGI